MTEWKAAPKLATPGDFKSAKAEIRKILTAERQTRAAEISARLVQMHEDIAESKSLRLQLGKICRIAEVSERSQDSGDRLVELYLADISAAMRSRYKKVLRIAKKKSYTPDKVFGLINAQGLMPFLRSHGQVERQKGRNLSRKNLEAIIDNAKTRVLKKSIGDVILTAKPKTTGWHVVLAYHTGGGNMRVYRNKKLKSRRMARLIEQYS